MSGFALRKRFFTASLPDGVASADDPGTAAELRRRVAEIEAGDRAGVSWAELKDTIERE